MSGCEEDARAERLKQKLKPLPKRSKSKSRKSKVAPSPVTENLERTSTGGSRSPECITPLKLPKSQEPLWTSVEQPAKQERTRAPRPAAASLGGPSGGYEESDYDHVHESRLGSDAYHGSHARTAHSDRFHVGEDASAHLENYPFVVGDSFACEMSVSKGQRGSLKRYHSTNSVTGAVISPKQHYRPRRGLDELSESPTLVQKDESLLSPKTHFRQHRLGSTRSDTSSWNEQQSMSDLMSPKRNPYVSLAGTSTKKKRNASDSSEEDTGKAEGHDEPEDELSTDIGPDGKGKHWNHWVRAMWFASQETNRIKQNEGQIDLERKKSEISASADLMGGIKPKKPDDSTWTFQEVALHAVRVQQAMRRQKLWIGMRSKPVLAFDFFCTLHIFLITDTFIICNPSPDYDIVIHAMTSVCFFFFLFELLLKATFHPTYLTTIHIWLESLTILSLLPDVLFALIGFNIFDTSPDVAGLHTSQTFYATFRVFKVFRIVPFLLRLYPHLVLYRKNWELSTNSDEVVIVTDKTQLISEVGLTIDRESMHQTVKVCCMMLAVSLANTTAGIFNSSNELELAVSLLKHNLIVGAEMDVNHKLYNSSIDTFAEAMRKTGDDLLYAEADSLVLWGGNQELDELRMFPPEGRAHRFPADERFNISIVLHLGQRERTVRQTAIDMGTSISIIAVICVMMYKISVSLNKDVVKPVEGMVSMISEFAHEPLKALKSQGGSQIYETKMVQRGLHKFVALLQLAFGEAGARVIKDNMEDGVIQTRLPGKIVHGIFGFCDIRRFTDITEVLQAQTAKLVNAVADRVHYHTCCTKGAPNKNIGDAFLLVWKPKGKSSVTEVVDGALKSFISIVLDLENADEIHDIVNSPELVQRLPKYKLNLGFGLHYGWAVESAIGSHRKIDASYLGPHVNLASRLESATKRYGVSILISGDTFRLLSSDVQDLCRLIDRVLVQGSQRPLDLYTYDCPVKGSSGTNVDKQIDLGSMDIREFFQLCAPRTSKEFRDRFRDAVNQYLGGKDGHYTDWISARSNLASCLEIDPSDGPSRELLKFIDKHRNGYGNAPDKWRGCRILIGK